MNVLTIFLAAVLAVNPTVKPFMEPIQKRDTVLVGDQFECGFEVKDLEWGIEARLPEAAELFATDSLVLVRNWSIDTLKVHKRQKSSDLRISLVVAPFEEGEISVPEISGVLFRQDPEFLDSLKLEAGKLLVSVMPVDTTAFEIKELKEPIRYPLTFSEVAPAAGGALILAAIVAVIVLLLRWRARKKGLVAGPADPVYIVALRRLEKYRSDKYWAPDKQKAFYSGITDVLKFYIEDRWGVDAPEMTTSELFDALKEQKDLPKDLMQDLRSLFETADFVKFAKHAAEQERNASALPLAIRFITSTYLKEEEGKDVL